MSKCSLAAEAAFIPIVAALACSVVALPVVASDARVSATPAAKKAAGADVFGATKVWPVHLRFSAKEYEAMQPPTRPTFFGWLQPKPAEKSDRQVHRNAFGFDLPLANGAVTIGDQ